jgi:hypothetical protein
MISKRILFGVIFLLLCLHVGRVTSGETRSFTVHFSGCTEFAGWGPVSLAEAQPLVPSGYVIAGAANGHAAIVVRATSCQGVAVGQSPTQPTELSQIGINLVAPDGTGDINNYTVIYVTNNRALGNTCDYVCQFNRLRDITCAGWRAMPSRSTASVVGSISINISPA